MKGPLRTQMMRDYFTPTTTAEVDIMLGIKPKMLSMMKLVNTLCSISKVDPMAVEATLF
jgi:hypothetical protein